jgi:arylsulfatase A-like enzyme
MWDPHTPYRAPADLGEPFADSPLPAWYTEDVRAQHWQSCGPHSARENYGYAPNKAMQAVYPRQPQETPDMAAARKMFDGYDTGVFVADDYVGRILNLLADLGVDDETVIMLSSDHGENLGELNVYGDHQTADQITTRIPMILHWPGLLEEGRFAAKHYHVDVFATVLELLERKVPDSWDGQSFAQSLREQQDRGREFLVVSQAAWACQRGVRFGDYLYLHTRHDAYHLWDNELLFDLKVDPHQQNNLAIASPGELVQGRDLLGHWLGDMIVDAARGRDPHVPYGCPVEFVLQQQ